MQTDELILKVVDGDTGSLELLLRQYHDWARSQVHSAASPELLRFADADEITQDAMMRCFRNIATLRFRGTPQAGFEAWLATVLRNAVRRFGRKRRQALLQLESEVTDGQEEEAPSPSKVLRRRERYQRLNDAIARLPESTQQMLEKSMNGWTHQQIAESMGQSKAAVNARLERARHRLRDLLGPTSLNFSSD